MRKMKKLIIGIAMGTLLLGSMVTASASVSGWLQEGNKWYYLNSDGTIKTGWLQEGSTWYYLNSDGTMKTGWLKEGSTWYYLNSDGSMKTGWLQEGNKWYYLNSDGSMAVNTTIDNCYVGADGSWTDGGSGTTATGIREGYQPEMTEEFVKLWNEERRALGLREVKITEWAQKYADIRIEELLQNFAHIRPDGSALYGGEDITKFYDASIRTIEEASKEALNNFKNSEGHWMDLTDHDIVECGVSVYYKDGEWYVTVNTLSMDQETYMAMQEEGIVSEAFEYAFKN